MRLDKQRLEQPFIGLDLALQFVVLFRPEARLALVRQHFVDVDLRAVGAEHRRAQAALLQADDASSLAAGFSLAHGAMPRRHPCR